MIQDSMSGTGSPFYTILSPYYDLLFPLEHRIASFLEESGAVAGARVADIACGSGLYTQTLLEKGVDAWGLDASRDLIEVARLRSRHPDRFLVADMRDWDVVDRLVAEENRAPEGDSPVADSSLAGSRVTRSPVAAWDLIYCIGNSVVHLPSREAVWTFLEAAVQRLRPAPGEPGTRAARRGGVLVLQWVELTGLAPGETRNLPPVGTGVVTMHRSHTRLDDDFVRFDVRLEVAQSPGGADGVIETSNKLLLLTGDSVGEHLSGLGFHAELFGGFSGEPGAPESWVRVMRVFS